MAQKMDAFSASLMADKREIIFAPTVYKFETFGQMAEELHGLGEEIGVEIRSQREEIFDKMHRI